LRYPSDLTDKQWALVEPLIPPAKRGGNRRTVNVREVVDGLDVRPEHRLPVAGASQGPAAAALDGL
jgi:transposase